MICEFGAGRLKIVYWRFLTSDESEALSLLRFSNKDWLFYTFEDWMLKRRPRPPKFPTSFQMDGDQEAHPFIFKAHLRCVARSNGSTKESETVLFSYKRLLPKKFFYWKVRLSKGLNVGLWISWMGWTDRSINKPSWLDSFSAVWWFRLAFDLLKRAETFSAKANHQKHLLLNTAESVPSLLNWPQNGVRSSSIAQRFKVVLFSCGEASSSGAWKACVPKNETERSHNVWKHKRDCIKPIFHHKSEHGL